MSESRPGAARPTYLGSVDGGCPRGFHRLQREQRLGTGGQDFRRGRAMVLSWRFLERAGLRIEASTDQAELGSVIRQHLGPVVAPCQIVEVFDGPDRAGFSYATLPGHPECGVERFTVEVRTDDTVWAVVESVSQAALWYARLGGPVTRFVQSRMVNRYLGAIAEEVTGSRRRR